MTRRALAETVNALRDAAARGLTAAQAAEELGCSTANVSRICADAEPPIRLRRGVGAPPRLPSYVLKDRLAAKRRRREELAADRGAFEAMMLGFDPDAPCHREAD